MVNPAGPFGAVAVLNIVIPILLAQSPPAHAGPITTTSVRICQTDPSTVHTTRSFGDTGYRLLETATTLAADTITLDVLVQDRHDNPDLYFAQVITDLTASARFDLLPPGDYTVHAHWYATRWPSTSWLDARLLDSAEASISVAPEPITLSTLALTALAFARRRTPRASPSPPRHCATIAANPRDHAAGQATRRRRRQHPNDGSRRGACRHDGTTAKPATGRPQGKRIPAG